VIAESMTMDGAVESQSISERMRSEWDERAKENAYHYVASDLSSDSEEEFDRSGWWSTEHAVVDDLERIARGRDPKTMTVLEIGCGAGRMTRHLAQIFGHVHAVDVSGEMVAQARTRLTDVANVSLHHTDGIGLSQIGAAQLDFALSYIVFQHIPDIEVIRGYIRQVAEKLQPGALFKFQVQGSPAVETMDRDTWTGVRFSALDAVRAAQANQLRIEDFEGVGEHYFWLSMRKDPGRGTEPDPVEQALLASEADALNAALAAVGGDLRELRHWSEEKLEELRHAAARMEQLDQDAQQLRRLSDGKTEELRRAAERIADLDADLGEARAKLRDLLRRSDAKAEELRSHIQTIYSSWAYRIGRRLGLAPPLIQEKDSD
jgi:SAM-dependent methyltransferase